MGSGSYVSIGELESLGAITAIQDGNHGNYHPKASEYTGSGIPFVMASDIKDGRVDLKGCSRLPKERTDRLRIGFAKSGDVLLTHKGTVGSVALAPNVPDYLMLTPQVTYYRTASDQLLPAYLAYAFREPGFQQQMISESAQSTRPYIGIQAQRRLRVRYVDIKNQHRIVSILSAYDDLIENNTRRIEILEEMARRLYEEWFVQFRFPGHEGVGLKESELGLIPEGWELLRLGDCMELAYGKALKAQDRVPGDYPVYGSSGVVGTHCESLVEGPGIVVGRKGNVGSVFWSDVSFFPIDTTYYVRSEVPFSYVYFNLQRQRFLNNDAAVPGLNSVVVN